MGGVRAGTSSRRGNANQAAGRRPQPSGWPGKTRLSRKIIFQLINLAAGRISSQRGPAKVRTLAPPSPAYKRSRATIPPAIMQ